MVSYLHLNIWPRSVHLSLLDVKILESGSGCTGFANITNLDKTAKSKPHYQPAAAAPCWLETVHRTSLSKRQKKLTLWKVGRQKFVFLCIWGSAVFSLKKVQDGQWWRQAGRDRGGNSDFLYWNEKGFLVVHREKGQRKIYFVLKC